MTRQGFRGDIEGLRAVAVVAVLLWHAGVPGIGGGFVGVDVFFVVSGFLITRMLLDQVRANGRVSLLDFYARRARRLLPAACVVLLVSLVATYAFLPPIRWSDTAGDVAAAAVYLLNWRLAHQATDYLAQGEAPSIVQHYWSLSVEEQFYLVWPALVLAACLLGARRGRDPKRLLLPAILVIAAGSFAVSVHQSTVNPEGAYFATATRGWELALGAVVAVAWAHLSRLPRAAAVALGWAGLAAVAVSVVVTSTSEPFPGYVALLPTLGAAGVVVGGHAAGRAGPGVLLDTRPARAVGALSYSLYLWHWPALVVAESAWGPLRPGPAVAVVAAAAVPAWLTYRFVENPIRRSRHLRHRPAVTVRSGALATVATAVVALLFLQLVGWPANRPTVTGSTALTGTDTAAGGSDAASTLGAAVLRARPAGDPKGAATDRVDGIQPDPGAVREDVPSSYALGCHQEESEDAALTCVFGPDDGEVSVALVGDSHATQWVPAFEVLAEEHRWRVTTYTKSSCPLADMRVAIGRTNRPYESCARWNDNVLAALTGPDRPDLVVVTSSYYRVIRDGDLLDAADGWTAYVEGLRGRWRQLAAAGLRVAALRDTPYPGTDTAACVSANVDRLTRCAYPREAALGGAGAAQAEAVRDLPGVRFVDLSDAICPTSPCAAVIGQVIVFRDTNHLTATYARSLAPRLRAELDRAGATGS
ncbi:acyltransferase family protein [Phytohabitans sp. ZYX-F-186]|uniref:Acyltransferase family protein n=1 Tax=Phytohabitans maris TaxID=3071409 RepID=A0ABU0ZFA8_9ACTN|nr:acyltransferase family protein [Phytohabitans sp. ZYX-F-186]MDQ7905748.1 acyltransferase family protein [Phytohabitans sp. ZYX-F-186]